MEPDLVKVLEIPMCQLPGLPSAAAVVPQARAPPVSWGCWDPVVAGGRVGIH